MRHARDAWQTNTPAPPDGVWTDFGANFIGAVAPTSIFDPVGANQFRFYRVYAPP